jgi:hypothetical protein
MSNLLQACNTFSKNIATRRCLPSGGLKTRCWVFQATDFTGANTFNANGSLSSFSLADDAQVITCTGRPKKGKGDNKLSKSEDGALSVEQALTLEIAYGTQHELDAIIEFLRADNKTVFVETNAGTIRQYFAEYGDGSMEGTEGTGLLVGDANNVVAITLKGTESSLPRFFEAAFVAPKTQLAASKDYLDALVTGAEVVD